MDKLILEEFLTLGKKSRSKEEEVRWEELKAIIQEDTKSGFSKAFGLAKFRNLA